MPLRCTLLRFAVNARACCGAQAKWEALVADLNKQVTKISEENLRLADHNNPNQARHARPVSCLWTKWMAWQSIA